MNNLDNVIKSIRLLAHPDGLHMGIRRFTVSACGLVEGIHRFIDEKLFVGLAFFLVTADQMLREKLMYTAKANLLPDIKAALLPGYNNRKKDA